MTGLVNRNGITKNKTRLTAIFQVIYGLGCEEEKKHLKVTEARLCVLPVCAVVWSCLIFIRSGQNHLARLGERGKKTRQTEEEVGRQGMGRPGVRQVPEGSGEQGKMGETGCEIICGAPTTLAVKG